jgi:hypothetical protein
MEQLVAAGRRHHDRKRMLLAEQRDAGVGVAQVAQHARAQAHSAPGRDVLGHADLVVGAGRAKSKRSRRHLRPRLLFQGIEIDTVHDRSPQWLSQFGRGLWLSRRSGASANRAA